jgi:hypothetical protein
MSLSPKTPERGGGRGGERERERASQPLVQWLPVSPFSTREKRPGREAFPTPLSGAEVKNMWSYTSILPVCGHSELCDNCTFTTIIKLFDNAYCYKFLKSGALNINNSNIPS